VPHTFFYVFGQASDLRAITIVEPVHSQAIGLVWSDRDPPPPMADALLASIKGINLNAELDTAIKRV
jgi:hypothetical protein